MSISVVCTNCKRKGRVSEAYRGKRVKCLKCDCRIQIPSEVSISGEGLQPRNLSNPGIDYASNSYGIYPQANCPYCGTEFTLINDCLYFNSGKCESFDGHGMQRVCCQECEKGIIVSISSLRLTAARGGPDPENLKRKGYLVSIAMLVIECVGPGLTFVGELAVACILPILRWLSIPLLIIAAFWGGVKGLSRMCTWLFNDLRILNSAEVQVVLVAIFIGILIWAASKVPRSDFTIVTYFDIDDDL